jgi:hypothetical protein
VFLAQEETTGRLFAVKVMKKEVRNIHKYAHIEEAVLRVSRVCPFIIQLFSSFQSQVSGLYTEYSQLGYPQNLVTSWVTINN